MKYTEDKLLLYFFLDKGFVLLQTAVSLSHVAPSASPMASISAVDSFASITAHLPQAHSSQPLTGFQTDASEESVTTKSQLTSHICLCAPNISFEHQSQSLFI